MHPVIHENFLSVLCAVVASFAFGWIWHGPVFGKLWLRLMKLKDMKSDFKTMTRSMAIGIVGTILTAHVMVYSSNIWRASVWGTGSDEIWWMYGFQGGFWVWLGFYVPMLLGTVAWEMRSWSLFFLNAAFSFFNLQIISMIVAYMYES